MTSKTVVFASAALAAMLFAYPQFVQAQNGPQIADASACAQAVANTKEARAQNPDIGEKSAKVFDEIVALAEQRCEEQQFKNADELLKVARGMVASE